MVQELQRKGITDQRVLAAMAKIPRHLFLDTALEPFAYEDSALPILCGQTISQPSTVATQSQLLDVQPGMKVLEIGTGSGYQTAVLCELGAKVYSIERQKGLFDKTKAMLYEMHYKALCFLGDGYQGLTEVDYGPFDRVVITCGAPSIPQAIVSQLKVGGLLVIPVGDGQQQMVRYRKTEGEPIIETFGNCRFVPMLDGKQFR